MNSYQFHQQHALKYNEELKVGEMYWVGTFIPSLETATTNCAYVPMCFKVVSLPPKKGRGYGKQPIKIETVEGKRHSGAPAYITGHNIFLTKEHAVEYYNIQVEEAKNSVIKKIEALTKYLNEELNNATLDIAKVGGKTSRSKGDLTI